ncbi:MAG: hypothetical protein WAQ56_05720, partial [Candidatus Nitrotoga sp.]
MEWLQFAQLSMQVAVRYGIAAICSAINASCGTVRNSRAAEMGEVAQMTWLNSSVRAADSTVWRVVNLISSPFGMMASTLQAVSTVPLCCLTYS